jgi:hypothetical protein
MKKIIKSGDRYGRLTILQEVEPSYYSNKPYRNFSCLCDCGNKKIVKLDSLNRKYTTSCGCYNKEKVIETNTTHGLTKTPEYRTWHNMKQRCYNPNSKRYSDWGGRGIKVCDEWINSFETFLKDMGKRPDGCSIDRIDNDGNYESSNCRWITSKEQSYNRRSNINKK